MNDAVCDEVLERISAQIGIPLSSLIDARHTAYEEASEDDEQEGYLGSADPEFEGCALDFFLHLVNSIPDEDELVIGDGIRLALSRRSEKVELPAWWLKMTERQRSAYVERHRNSKYSKFIKVKSGKKRNARLSKKAADMALEHDSSVEDPTEDAPEVDAETSDAPDEGDTPEVEEPEKDAAGEKESEETESRVEDPAEDDPEVAAEETPDKHDDEEPEKDAEGEKEPEEHDPRDDLPFTRRVVAKVKDSVSEAVVNEKKGAAALKKFFSAKKLTDDEKEDAKRVAKHAAVALMGVIGAVALFTPLGPYVSVLGDAFMESWKGGLSNAVGLSESAEAEEIEDNKVADVLCREMYNWMARDPEVLLKQLQEQYPEIGEHND